MGGGEGGLFVYIQNYLSNMKHELQQQQDFVIYI